MKRSGFVAASVFFLLSGCEGAPKAPAPAATPPGTVFHVSVEGAPLKGPADALVTVVEFTDFQCPFCGRANATLDALAQEYGPRVRWAVRQTPLAMHAHAHHAALAALAAETQGRYWPMHDALFRHQNALDDASVDRYAGEIGLSLSAFHAALESTSVQQALARDEAIAAGLGVSSTPTFFINGRKLSGAQPIDVFRHAIDSELSQAQAWVKQGTPPGQIYARAVSQGGAPSADAEHAAGCTTGCNEPDTETVEVKTVEVPSTSPARGPATAKVTVVEWSDFECPFCATGEQTLKQVEQLYGNEVRVVFRHHPLPMHSHATLASAAAMAAQEQGKFWEYHDVLFSHQDALDRASLEHYADELGLNAAQFRSALDSHKYESAVAADLAAGAQLGVAGTPTFFVNGHQLTGAKPLEVFKTVIDQELNKAR